MMLKYCLIVFCCASFIKMATAKNVSNKCIRDLSFIGVLNCGMEKIIKTIDFARFTKRVEVFPGISIVRDASTSFRTPRELRDQYVLPTNPNERNDKLLSLLLNATNGFIAGRSLQITLPNTTMETIGRALEEGRGRMKKMANPWMLGLGVTSLMMIPVILGTLTLFSIKSLLVAKAALILSAIVFIQSFLSASSILSTSYGYGNGIPSYGVSSYPHGVNHLGGWSSIGWN